MTGFADTLRGDGLARVHRALDGLEADPLGLDRARTRFSQPPPSYTSNPSGTTTRSVSPEPPRNEQRRREQREQRFQRRRKLMDERAASLPLEQFLAQVDEETRRIWNANPRTSLMSESKIPIGGTEEKEATETIKKRWVQQGIWKDKWDEMAAGRYMNVGKWKHEEPLELESESETDTEAESPPPTFSIFGVPQKQPQPKPRRPKSNDEKQRVAERRAVREREREASRPYHQFVYQISKERERIQDESANGEGTDAADIDSRAYENVKNTWTKRGIWNGKWGILPGMSWKHEWPLEEEAADDPAPVPANPSVNGSHDAGEAPTRRIFGSPSPVASNRRQTSGIMNTSRQGLSADVDSARPEDGDVERSPSTSNSLRPRTGKRVLRPTTGQTLRPSRQKPYHKDGQPQPVASASLGPVHSSKVSKATGRKRPGPRRRPNTPQGVPPGGPPLLSGPGVAGPLPQAASVPPRRSKRLQPPEPSIAKGPTGITSADSLKSIAQSRPKRKAAGNPISMVSAKPQGISKRQRSSTTRGKARKG
ncbi:hypothetical protein K469DRAFT_714121 [Zopfia rhizophila CBS 207.26]|uniref:Uncharacterized protein n=1 Tax=Zopfia rhizophila CBS 207.26 TaxID=1314779 RepID=A0A6A6DRK9_9PEZI|nr:hypothetical protein K469DRAFT_714121 [Zopfia rhizophila CBS 207.26]